MSFDKVNAKVVRTDLRRSGDVLARTGGMLFYTGDVRFRPHGAGGGAAGAGAFGGGILGVAGRMVAGEHEPMMAASGAGEVHYGYGGLHLTVVPLQGQTMTVEASRLLAHTATLQTSVVMLGQQGGLRSMVRGAMSGQGMFTSQLSGQGSVVVMSHGGTVELEVGGRHPVVVDPQAYVGHVGNVRVDLAVSGGWRDAVGRGSGEATQLRLSGQGTVLVQASEIKL